MRHVGIDLKVDDVILHACHSNERKELILGVKGKARMDSQRKANCMRS